MNDQLKLPEAILSRRLHYEKMIADILSLAFTSDDLSHFLQKCLEIIGNSIDLSRTYIFRHYHETDTMDNTFEWFAPGIPPQKEELQGVSAKDAPWWVETLKGNRIINYRDIEELPYEAEKNILRPQQIKSILVVPLFVKNIYYGFIGFDECRCHREWPPEDIALLKSISEIITMSIEREQDRQLLKRNEALLRATIDSLPFDLFVIDKDGRYSIINSAGRLRWGELTGKRPEEVAGDVETLRQWIANNTAAFSGETVTGEVRLNFNGVAEDIYNIVSPVRIDNEVIAIVIINIDISDLKRAEQDLRTSEKRYRELVENMSEVVYIINPSGRIAFISPSVTNMAHYTPAEVKGRLAEDFIHKEDLHRFERNLHQALTEGKITENEYRIVTASGEIRWVATSTRPILSGKEITGIQGTLLDITEKKQSEEALRKSEALLSATEQLTKVGGWEWDIEKQAMFWTDEVYRIHDLEPDNISPGSPDHIPSSLQCYDPVDQSIIEAAFKKCAETGESYDFEFPFTTLKGCRLWIRTTARPIFENDKIVKVVGNIMDVTDRKRIEEALRENEERFRAIFNNAAVGMALTSITGNILKANKTFSKFLGYSSEELINMHFSEVTHPEDVDTDTNLYRELIEGVRDRYMYDKRYIRKDGQTVWGRLGLSMIREVNGSPKYGIGTCEDITDRKLADKELRKAKGELEIKVRERTAELSRRAEQLARLSSQLTLTEQQERRRLAEILHDHLQQLLVAARMNCEVLLSGKIERRQLVENTLNLISQSIQASRSLTAELSPQVLRQGSLSAALEWLARWVQETHGLTVELSIDSSADPAQEQVSTLLFQSVRELLFNVVKHAAVKTARVEMAPHKENQLRINVIDRGRGLDPNAIWEKGEKGFGLLSIRERLELLGGSFEIKSSPGKGASFSLFVPLETKKEQDEVEIQKIITKVQETKISRDKIQILLVDDHTVVRKGLSTMLNLHSDIQVIDEAADGQEAVEKARDLQPDVILMDISMPKMDGIQATRIISSELPHIRIIGLSMHDKQDQADQMIEAGASAYCTKDGATDILLSEIRAGGGEIVAI